MKKEDIEIVQKIFKNEEFVGNVCMSFRHDFGLMNEKDRELLIFECKEWMRSIVNNLPYHKEL